MKRFCQNQIVMINEIIQRPITPLEEFEIALNKAELSDKDYELIDYIRYTSVFTQPSLIKDLKDHQNHLFLQIFAKYAEKSDQKCLSILKK